MCQEGAVQHSNRGEKESESLSVLLRAFRLPGWKSSSGPSVFSCSLWLTANNATVGDTVAFRLDSPHESSGRALFSSHSCDTWNTPRPPSVWGLGSISVHGWITVWKSSPVAAAGGNCAVSRFSPRGSCQDTLPRIFSGIGKSPLLTKLLAKKVSDYSYLSREQSSS